MPTIQFKISEDEFKHLQSLSGEATGSKALHFIIQDYQRLTRDFHLLTDNHNLLNRQHNDLARKVSMFSRLITDFQSFE